jgi:hypothetical protein
MQGMATGGIVAFEAGGEVPRFNGQTGSLYRDIYSMTPDEIKEQAARKLRMEAARAGLTGAAAIAPEAGGLTYLQGLKAAAGRAAGPLMMVGQNLFGTSDEEMKTLREADARRAMQGMPESTFKGTGDTSEIDKMATDMAAQQAATDGSKGDKVGTGKPTPSVKVDGGKKTPAAINPAPGIGKPPAAPTTDAAQRGLGSIAEYAKEANDYAGADPTARQLERIEKQEAGAAGEKKDALNMALLKAGLGMMSGTSRYAFENIGKGAMAGAEEYGAAMKDLKRAGLERDKMRDAAEQAAYAYKRDDVKGYRAAQEKVADRKTEMEKAQLAASTQLQAAGITAGAHLKAASMPGAQERLFASLGGGDVGKGLKVFQEAQTDKTGLGFAKLYIDHVTDSRKAGADPMSEQDFLATMTRLSSQMNPKVVKDPKGEVLAR